MTNRRRASRAAAAAVLAVLAGLLAGCSGPAAAPHRPTPSPSPPVGAATPEPTSTPVALKEPLRGLLSRDGPPSAALAGAFGGYVVNVYWKDLQPSAGADVAANNAIDQAVQQVRALNGSGQSLGLKLRIFAGIYAPDWLKSMDGPPITVRDPASGSSGTVGRFWNDDFGRAYADLETRLAARYDSVPEIREVTISRCMTVFAEPFIRNASDPATVSALLGAGFTADADAVCHREQIEAHTAWRTTRSDLSFNPYQVITSAGTIKADESFTDEMMGTCRSVLGARCVLENNSLRSPALPAYAPMYARMKQLGPPMTFQTAALARVGGIAPTVQYAAQLGAASVELPAGYQSMALSDLQAANQLLQSAATG